MLGLKSLGPAVARVPATEALRAGIGAFLGLGLTGLVLLSPDIDFVLGLYLVAPFGATSVLLFAVPNSPLAQPWSAIVGNTVAALVGVGVCLTINDPGLRIALAVGLAITAMILCRAVHPPAGAVAMTAAMNPEAIAHLGVWFALAPIALGTTALVVLATLYARLTGRHYPFRQFDDPSKHDTQDRNPSERLGLSQGALTEILERYSQSFNLGVEDLVRLIGAAELQAAAQSAGPLTTQEIMSHNLVTVGPDATLDEIAALFQHHRFTALPVTGPDAQYLGVIFQIDLISQRANTHSARDQKTLVTLKRRVADIGRARVVAQDIMNTTGPRAGKDTPISALLPLMADGQTDALPVIDGTQLVGLVTGTDLIAALARTAIRHK